MIEIENVLSLFDGMSCGQIALNKAKIPYKKYFASEIDKHAIEVTQHNYPHTEQLGDVTKVSGYDLPKIDLLIGGSPCQGFSMAGKMLNFNDPRSKLFFEYVRILNECREKNPNIKFLLENVRMEKWCQDVISRYLGVYPVVINSSLVSAQNRKRWYWTNINFDSKIKDKGLVLSDILESNVDEKYYLSDKLLNTFPNEIAKTNQFLTERSPIQLSDSKESGGKQPYQQNRIYDTKGTSPALLAQMSCGSHAILENKNYFQYDLNGGGNNSQDQRIYFEDSKMGALSASRTDTKTKTLIGERIRRLTPLECERLQTVPENFTSISSDTQRYKMLGNGWTIDVIVEIFKGLNTEIKSNNRQYATTLF